MRGKNHLMQTVKDKKVLFNKIFRDQFISRQYKTLWEIIGIQILRRFFKVWFILGQFPFPQGWEIIKNDKGKNFVWLGKEIPFQWTSIAKESYL